MGVTVMQSHRLQKETQKGQRPAISIHRSTDRWCFETPGQTANALGWRADGERLLCAYCKHLKNM